jgi:hypothetical protein
MNLDKQIAMTIVMEYTLIRLPRFTLIRSVICVLLALTVSTFSTLMVYPLQMPI